jgi:hypothetical protein
MDWNGRWPVRRDLRFDRAHFPMPNLSLLERSLGGYVPTPALIVVQAQANQFPLVNTPSLEIPVAASVESPTALRDAQIELVAALDGLVDVANCTVDAQFIATLVAPDEQLSRVRTAWEAVKLAAQERPPVAIVREVRSLPAGASGWWLTSPVFVLPRGERIDAGANPNPGNGGGPGNGNGNGGNGNQSPTIEPSGNSRKRV